VGGNECFQIDVRIFELASGVFFILLRIVRKKNASFWVGWLAGVAGVATLS
jgi:hypothetical protein